MSLLYYTNDFVQSTTDYILGTIDDVLKQKSFFCLTLCGGRSALPVYLSLANGGAHVPWDRIIITFSDERCAPLDHDESTYRLIQLNLLGKISIPEENVLRIRGEYSPEMAAREYETQLDQIATRCKMDSFKPDLALLGQGDDGHIASHLPDTGAFRETGRRVVSSYIPQSGAYRITFTISFMNQAERILILEKDRKKKELIDSHYANGIYDPAARIGNTSGSNLVRIVEDSSVVVFKDKLLSLAANPGGLLENWHS